MLRQTLQAVAALALVGVVLYALAIGFACYELRQDERRNAGAKPEVRHAPPEPPGRPAVHLPADSTA